MYCHVWLSSIFLFVSFWKDSNVHVLWFPLSFAFAVKCTQMIFLKIHSNVSVALVLDLSKPEELWHTLETWLNHLRSVLETVIGVARGSDPGIKDSLQKAAWERVGQDHVVSTKKNLNSLMLSRLLISMYFSASAGQRYDNTILDTSCHHWCQVWHIPGKIVFFNLRLNVMYSLVHDLLLSRLSLSYPESMHCSI